MARLGVAPGRVVRLLRQDPLLPLGVAAGWVAERLIRRTPSGHGGLFNPDALPWTSELRDRWQVVRGELDALLDQDHPIPRFRDLHAAFTPVDAWRVHMFYAYGLRSARNCAACPETAALLDAIPDIQTAMFSILPPHPAPESVRAQPDRTEPLPGGGPGELRGLLRPVARIRSFLNRD